MRTYAETKGAEPFDWNEALEGLSTGTEAKNQIELNKLAHLWVTCACGNLCADIPRHPGQGCPTDEQLAFLGDVFARHVLFCRWNDARQTLAEIEKRSGEILAKLGKPE